MSSAFSINNNSSYGKHKKCFLSVICLDSVIIIYIENVQHCSLKIWNIFFYQHYDDNVILNIKDQIKWDGGGGSWSPQSSNPEPYMYMYLLCIGLHVPVYISQLWYKHGCDNSYHIFWYTVHCIKCHYLILTSVHRYMHMYRLQLLDCPSIDK